MRTNESTAQQGCGKLAASFCGMNLPLKVMESVPSRSGKVLKIP